MDAVDLKKIACAGLVDFSIYFNTLLERYKYGTNLKLI